MLVARLEIDVDTAVRLDDIEIMTIVDRLGEIDFKSLILSKFTASEIDKLGLFVTTRGA